MICIHCFVIHIFGILVQKYAQVQKRFTVFSPNERAIITEKFRKLFAQVEELNPILCLQYYN
jgi:uncharacterized protein with WD repeat